MANIRNPYYNSQLNEFADGTQELSIPIYKSPINFVLHRVKPNETLSDIAYEYYHKIDRDPSKWAWIIAEENSIEEIWNLTNYVGQDIRIPDLNEVKLNL